MWHDGIVVGVNGDKAGRSALEWAAHEAARRGAPLKIVHALDGRWGPAPDGGEPGCLGNERRLGEAIVAEALDHAHATAPVISLKAVVCAGRPVPDLLEISRHADLMVVGTREAGGFTGLLLRSIGSRLASRAGCPVVVVRGRRDSGATNEPVVAGVDDSDLADVVLATAFEAAANDGKALTVVRASLQPAAGPPPDLERRMAPWRERFPDVRVSVQGSRGSAIAVLTAATRHASLVVVGSHGRGVLTSAFLGSTAHHLLHHADCPVLVVRPAALPRDVEPPKVSA